MIAEWLIPWHPVDREDERSNLLAELQRELDAAHPLNGLNLTPIGRRQDNDDVLFSLTDGRVAVVHLTWSAWNRSPFPSTVLYMSPEAFVQECMTPDHRQGDE